jgi:pimeloyl-ACP methyl ester carboxylesterase
MLTTRAFKTGELTLSYAEGPVNGPPLVMLHGVLGRWQDFAGMIPHLTDSWHVYAIDLRGHGESDRAPLGGGYSLRDLVGDISIFLRDVLPDEGEIVLVGFSAGGLAAIPLAVATQLSKTDPDVTNPDVLDRVLEDVDMGAMLEAVTCPILLFHGEPSLGSVVQPDDLAWLRRHASDVEIVPVAGAGHEIPMDVVVEHGQRFLQRRAPH